MKKHERFASILVTVGWVIATAVVAGVLAAGAFLGIPAEIMFPWLSGGIMVVALITAVPMGGRVRPSSFEDWELMFIFISALVLMAYYPLTMEGYLSGTLEVVYSWATFAALQVVFALINFR